LKVGYSVSTKPPFDEFQADHLSEAKPYAPPETIGRERSHRGGIILVMGILSLIASLGGILMCCCFLAGVMPLVGTVTGVIAFCMGRADLGAMNRGELDDRERGQIQIGTYLGLAGAIVGGLLLIAYAVLMVFGLASNFTNQRVNF